TYTLEVSYQTTKFWVYKTAVSSFLPEDAEVDSQPPQVETSKISSLKFFESSAAKKLGGIFDRRKAVRLNHRLGAVLMAQVPVAGAAQSDDGTSVLFMGITQNVSQHGIALIIPAIGIDKTYCRTSKPMNLSLHLRGASVSLQVEPIFCAPLQQNDP